MLIDQYARKNKAGLAEFYIVAMYASDELEAEKLGFQNIVEKEYPDARVELSDIEVGNFNICGQEYINVLRVNFKAAVHDERPALSDTSFTYVGKLKPGGCGCADKAPT